MNIHFFANLSNDNAAELSKGMEAREAVLLSTPGAARKTLDTVRIINEQNILLAADNGNTSIIFKIVDEFTDRAKLLTDKLEQEKKTITSPPSKELSALFKLLVNDVAKRCKECVSLENQKIVLATQAQVKPVFFICLEELTIPILVQLDIEPVCSGYRRPFFINLQKSGIQMAEAVITNKTGITSGLPYATLHAFDYDSAYQVSKNAAQIPGLQAIATGMASFMNDRNYINSYVINGRRIWIKGKQLVPQRYLRILQVSLGFLDGFSSERGNLPYFHGLGAGAPIVLPLLSLCTYGSPLLSVDSTSPEKNASMGKLFVNIPAPLTLSLESVAQALVDGRTVWNCPCPYCTSLQQEIPYDLESARDYFNAQIAPRKINFDDLKLDNGIGQWLSICWGTNKQPAKKSIYQARVNHNHWVIAGIVKELRNRSNSYSELRDWVGAQCEAYKATAQPTYALQIDECLKLIDRLRPN